MGDGSQIGVFERVGKTLGTVGEVWKSLPEGVQNALMGPLLNAVGDDLEETFVIEAPDTEGVWSGLAIMKESQAKGRLAVLDLGFPEEDEVLRAFELFANGRDHEVAVFAWTDECDTQRYRYFLVVLGDANTVSVPVRTLLQRFRTRTVSKIPTRVLLLHNHPEGLLGGKPKEWLGSALGPSGRDRDVMSAFLEYASPGLEFRFLLWDHSEWRAFSLPSVRRIREMVRSVGDTGDS